jgi:hypothetical protein
MSSLDWLALVSLSVALFSTAVCGAMIVAGLRRRAQLAPAASGNVLFSQPHPRFAVPERFELGRTPFSAGLLDVAAEVRAVLDQVEPEAAPAFVRLELAVQPGLSVHADRRAFRDIVGNLVRYAVRRSPCGQVLVGGMRHGGRVQISVTDDGAVASEGAQASALRDVGGLIALLGGTIHVETRAGEGTTVLVRLPGPADLWTPVQPDPARASADVAPLEPRTEAAAGAGRSIERQTEAAAARWDW